VGFGCGQSQEIKLETFLLPTHSGGEPKFIKELCFAGLSKKGFSRREINKIYNGQANE